MNQLICMHCTNELVLDSPLISFGIIKDLKTEKILHSPVNSLVIYETVSGDNVLYLVNQNLHHSNRTKYRLSDIDGLYTKMVRDGWVALRFTSPSHMILLHFQYSPKCMKFELEFMQPLKKLLKYKIKDLDKTFDPRVSDYMSPERFDRSTMDVGGLSTLILEDVIVPSLTECIGQSPISYISLSRSKLGMSQQEPDNFWDWMSEDTVCNTLTVLEMNSISLKKLPLEIIFLKKLTTLSVSMNQLIFIPHYIGELKKLQNFFIDNNKLRYLPECLQTRVFKHINYANNEFKEFNDSLEEAKESQVLLNPKNNLPIKKPFNEMNDPLMSKKKVVCFKLSNISFFSLINSGVKFKRRDLSLAVIKNFDFVFRCNACHNLMIPDTDYLYAAYFVRSLFFIQNQVMINWQYFNCQICCINYNEGMFKNLYA